LASGHRLQIGFDLPGAEDIYRALTETATSYLHLGWSVVPLWGDSRPEQAKVPALAWASYQRRRASEQDITRWFSNTPYHGLGIVTGRISQLVVLDFDDPTLPERFAAQHPELAATRTVRTRRGQHLYFRVPAYLRLPTRKLAGVDLLSDGCYVVAPPSVVDGHTYTVEQGGLRLLTPDDLTALNTFLDRQQQKRAVQGFKSPTLELGRPIATPTSKTQEGALWPEEQAFLKTLPSPIAQSDRILTADAVVGFYRTLAGQSGRNVALFKTACLARDHGWKHEAVAAVLAPVHAEQPARGQHNHESAKARRREAERTIRSAFSKPPRPPQPQDKGGLFNSIREKLLQLKLTCVVRVLEGLQKAGLKAGQWVTEQVALTHLAGLVGRRSVRNALAARTPDGAFIFKRRSPRYPPQRSAASHRQQTRQKNAYVREKKWDKTSGRPSVRYRIPSAEALCRWLGVTPSGSDPLTLDDLKSAKTTRQALHRGLFARRPGTYSRQWLGRRLGLCERSISNYNRATPGVNVVPTFTQTRLGWGNLNAIPAPEVMPTGTCLEDSTGKRWPAVKGIAQKLLAQGRGVRLLVRSLNYYWAGQGEPPSTADFQVQRAIDVRPIAQTHTPIVAFAQQIERLVRTVGKPTPLSTNVPSKTAAAGMKAEPVVHLQQPISTGNLAYTKGRRRKARYTKALADPHLEQLANTVYGTVNSRVTDPERRLSMASARQWVDRYGQGRVEQALAVLERRQHVTAPAGFVATLLRTAAIE
jgi:hypothetical protein